MSDNFVYVVKEVEHTNEGSGLKNNDISIKLHCFENEEDAKKFLKEQFSDKVYEHFDYAIPDDYYDEHTEDPEPEEVMNMAIDEDVNGRIEYSFNELSAMVSQWDEFGEGVKWTIEIGREILH